GAASERRATPPRIGSDGRSRNVPCIGPGEPPPGVRGTSRETEEIGIQQGNRGVAGWRRKTVNVVDRNNSKNRRGQFPQLTSRIAFTASADRAAVRGADRGA